jgi:ABC-type glycerol-3-phosphate transport system substrate-binding protein
LEAFEAQHPGVSVEVRVKAATGPGGLVDSLSAASSVAPAALPDLLALDTPSLTHAASKGLVFPMKGDLDVPRSPAWYEHAVQASLVGEEFYALPIGTQAQVLAYRPAAYAQNPSSWSELIEGEATLLLPLGERESHYLLIHYLAEGGSTIDEEGRPVLDVPVMTRVLRLYQAAVEAEALGPASLGFLDATQTWKAFLDGGAASAASPLGDLLAELPSSSIAGLPYFTGDGASFVPGVCWTWALVTQDPSRQAMAMALMDWLNEAEFLGEWTRALGLLPPHQVALEVWPEDAKANLVSRILPATRPSPSSETLATFGPILHTAVEAIVDQRLTPEEAAEQAAGSLTTP